MAAYRLSKAAVQDLDGILEYGIDTYGLESALTFKGKLEERFGALVKSPRRYQAVEHISPGLRHCPFKDYTIYYRIQSSSDILIVRILRGQDPSKSVE